MAVISYPPSAICYQHFVACNPLPVGFYMCSVYKHFLMRETWKYNIRGSFVVTRGHSWSFVVTRGHSWSFVCPFRQDPLIKNLLLLQIPTAQFSTSIRELNWKKVIIFACCWPNSWPILSKRTHEWPRVTTNDHEWPRVTTNDHEWPRMTTSDHEWPTNIILPRFTK